MRIKIESQVSYFCAFKLNHFFVYGGDGLVMVVQDLILWTTGLD